MELEHKRPRLRCFVSTIVLKICFSCSYSFLLFVMLAGPHFAISHFLIVVNDSVSCRFQRIRNFHKISSHCGTMTWVNNMQCFKERFSAIIIVIINNNNDDGDDDDDDDDNDCGTLLCPEFDCFSVL